MVRVGSGAPRGWSRQDEGSAPLCWSRLSPGDPRGRLWLPPSAAGDALAPIPPRGVLGGGDLVGCSLLPSGSSYTAELEVNTGLPWQLGQGAKCLWLEKFSLSQVSRMGFYFDFFFFLN